MANFKKEDKASMLARLDELEKRMDELEKVVAAPVMGTTVSMPGMVVTPVTLPVTADGKTLLTDKTIFAAVPAAVVTTEQHKCQTNTCASMNTKPYDRPSGRLWLCESHKF